MLLSSKHKMSLEVYWTINVQFAFANSCCTYKSTIGTKIFEFCKKFIFWIHFSDCKLFTRDALTYKLILWSWIHIRKNNNILMDLLKILTFLKKKSTDKNKAKIDSIWQGWTRINTLNLANLWSISGSSFQFV